MKKKILDLIRYIEERVEETRKVIKQRSKPILTLNIFLIVFQFVYIYLRYKYINVQVPFWFSKTWGDYEFAPKSYLYLIPAASALVLITGTVLEFLLRRYFIRYLRDLNSFFITLIIGLLTYSLLNIIFSASTPFPPLIKPLYFSLLVPFVVGFVGVSLVLHRFISWAKDNDLVTNPQLHNHPGMSLKKPSARGGGFVFSIVFLFLAIIFVGFSKELLGIYLAIFMLGVLGIVDDWQNTHRDSRFKSLEKPLLRLLLLFATVSVVVISGVLIKTISLPFDGLLVLDSFKLNILGNSLPVISMLFTMLWIVWVLNLLSWSNGIDGQYSGIVGIAFVFICILSLRFTPMLNLHKDVAVLAALAAGIAFGFTQFTWHPSLIMWGFGATSAGMVISGLSILINTKILASILILLIPFLDAIITFIRRILQKKSPFNGDRGHFHHLLMDRGWSVPHIAMLYWISTFIFGLVAIFASGKYLIQSVVTLGGIVAFIIILLNVKSLKGHN